MNRRGLSAYLGRPAWAQPYKTKGIDRYVYALSRYEQADRVHPQSLHDGERGGTRRARQIAAEAEVTGEPLPEKPVTMAIGEVAEGKYVSDPVIEEDEA